MFKNREYIYNYDMVKDRNITATYKYIFGPFTVTAFIDIRILLRFQKETDYY